MTCSFKYSNEKINLMWNHIRDMQLSTTDHGTCTIHFTDESEKAKAFYELIHSKAQFSGVDKNTLIINKKDRTMLKSKNIIYQEI